jgi:hypothetical protein
MINFTRLAFEASSGFSSQQFPKLRPLAL